MLLRVISSLAIGLAAVGVLQAQDPKGDPKEPAKPAAPAEPSKDPAKPATPPTAAETDFNKLFTEWRALLVKLRDVHIEYEVTKPDSRQPVLEKFNQLMAQGQALEPNLRKAAMAVFVEAPDKHPEVKNLLLAMLNRDVRLDRYEAALPLAQLLAERNVDNKRVYDLAGQAAFGLNDYDLAEKYLKIAAENSALSTQGTKFQAVLAKKDELKASWQKEQETRAAEAKADDLPRVKLKTTKGDIVLELYENEAPIAVANFISLVEKKFYDGVPFHRVLEGFMAQGGDPTGKGNGGPGYRIPGEADLPNHRLHFRGSLSMGLTAGDKDSGGSQFFLTFTETDHLNGLHTVFGRVIEGLDVLGKLTRRDPEKPGQPSPDKIIEATVLRKRNHPYEPKKLPEVKP